MFRSAKVPLAKDPRNAVGKLLEAWIEVLASMSTVPQEGLVVQQAFPLVYTCNRLGRQATLPRPGWVLAHWWRRATRRSTAH